MKSSTIMSIVGVAAVMLVIGTALGSVTFSTTKTETTTLLSSVTSTQTETQTLLSNVSGQLYPVITITYQGVFVYPVVGTCTTVSGKVTVEYYEAIGGYTTATYLFPSNYTNQLPDKFYATVTTASNEGASNATESFTGTC